MSENKYIMYLRKSTKPDDRQALSIPAQERELQALTERLKLRLVGPPIKEAMTAKRPGRPLFQKMLEDIRKKRRPVFCVGTPTVWRATLLMVERSSGD